MNSLVNIPASIIPDIVVLFKTNKGFVNHPTFANIPIGFVRDWDEGFISPFVIDTERDCLHDNYKISMTSMHPTVPNVRLYISDFFKILNDLTNDSNALYNNDAGLYYKEELFSDDEIRRGDLILVDGTHIEGYGVGCDVLKIKDIRHFAVTKRLLGRFVTSHIFPAFEKATDNTTQLCNTDVTFRDKVVGQLRVFRLISYSLTSLNPLKDIEHLSTDYDNINT